LRRAEKLRSTLLWLSLESERSARWMRLCSFTFSQRAAG